MKFSNTAKTAASAATLLAFFCGCDRAATTQAPPQTVNVSVVLPPPQASPQVAPQQAPVDLRQGEGKAQYVGLTQQAVTTEDLPPPPKFAPEGIYYLRNPVRIETEAGIVGHKRGTKLFKTNDGLLKTGRGELVTTEEVNLTNDMDEIRGILEEELASESSLKRLQAVQAQAESIRQAEATGMPLPPGTQMSVTTSRSADLNLHQTRTVTVTRTATPRPTTQAVPPATSLERGAYNATRVQNGAVYRKGPNGQWVFDHWVR